MQTAACRNHCVFDQRRTCRRHRGKSLMPLAAKRIKQGIAFSETSREKSGMMSA
jgi:hypothetical protein